MAPIPIIHQTTKSAYPGIGQPTATQRLASTDWNQTHFNFLAGNGVTIDTDGASPPNITISTGGGTTSVGGDILPSLDNTFNIGSNSLRWKHNFFSGVTSVGTYGSALVIAGVRVGAPIPLNQIGVFDSSIHIEQGGAGTLRFNCNGGDFYFGAEYGAQPIALFGPNNDLRSGVNWSPLSDNALTLGLTNRRWQAIYGTNLRITQVNNTAAGITFSVDANPIGQITTSGLLNNEVDLNLDILKIASLSGTTYALQFGNSGTQITRDSDPNLLLTSAVTKFSAVASAGSGFQTNSTTILSLLNGGAFTWSGLNLILNNPVGAVSIGSNNVLPINDATQNFGSATARWGNGTFALAVSAGSGFQTNVNGTGLQVGSGGKIDFTPGPARFAVGGTIKFEFDTAEIYPKIDNQIQLGTTNLRWTNIFYTTTLSGGSIIVSGITNNGTLTQAGNINPAVDATYDLGSTPLSLRWRNASFTGTVSVGAAGTGNYLFTSGSTFAFNALGNYILKINGANIAELQATFLRPSTDNTVDLGQAANRFLNGYFATAVSVGTTSITSQLALTNAGNYTVIGAMTGQGGAIQFGNSAANTWTIDNSAGIMRFLQPGTSYYNHSTGAFYPTSDATLELGLNATNRWKNAYFSSAVSIGTTGSIVSDASGNWDIEVATNKQITIGGSVGVLQLGGLPNSVTVLVGRNSNLELGNSSTNTLGVIRTWGSASTISAGGGFLSSANVGYLGTGVPAFRAQAGSDNTKYVQTYHDGSNGVIQIVGTSTLIINVPTSGLVDYSGPASRFRFHGTGSQHNTFSNSDYQLVIQQNLTPSGTYFQSHVSVGGHFNPDTVNTFDIGGIIGANGAVGNTRWRNAYVSGTVSAGGVGAGVGGVVTNTIYIPASQEFSFQTYSAVNVAVDRIHLGTGNLYPITNIELGLNNMGTNAWKNVYVQTALSVGASGTGGSLFFDGTNIRVRTPAAVILEKTGADSVTWDAASWSASTDNARDLGTATVNRWRRIHFATATSFGGASALGTGFTSNTSAAIQLGGTAVALSGPSNPNASLKIPIIVNGVTKYLQVFDN